METVQSGDGTTIAFDRVGDGPALILVGGALSDRSAATALATLLAPSFTVYGYDRRGRGSSGDTAPYSVDREVEDLDAIIREAGGSALVYGMSSGAMLALEAASRDLAITRLAVYEPPFIVDDTRPRPAADLADRLGELISSRRRGDAVKLFLVEAVALPPDVVEMIQAAPVWQAMEAVAHTLLYDMAIFGDGSIAVDRMARIRIPVLAIDGGASPDWARHSVRALAAAVPDAQHITLEGQTHDVDPEALRSVLVEFLS